MASGTFGFGREYKEIYDIEKFIEMDVSDAIPCSASIYVRKGK